MLESSGVRIEGTLEGGTLIKRGPSAYSPAQAAKWLVGIEFPNTISEDDIAHNRFPATLENLILINRLFLVAVPYENPGDDSKVTYLVDVGCGGSGPSRPLLLSASNENIAMGTTPTERHKLTRGAHPDSRITSNASEWQLNVIHLKGGPDTTSPWRVVYAFSEMECFPTDYENANFAVYGRPGGFFWDNVIASKHFWLNEQESYMTQEEPNSTIETRHLGRFGMEGAVIRKHVGNQTEIVKTATTEVERIEALREFFGIQIASEDLKHIHGRVAALK
ncbi:hypothetical protein H0H93_008379 [Arthromyces matolae]|nr:hypothetical protein H0H93_008379 [Arthromyces matolae]